MAETSLLDRAEWVRYLDAHRRYFAHNDVKPSTSDFAAYEPWQSEHSRMFDAAQALRNQVTAELRPEDLPALLDALEGDAITIDQRAIVFVLMDPIKKKDSRISETMRQRWIASFERKMAASYPDDGSVFSFLNLADADRAKAALQSAVSRLSLDTLPARQASVIVSHAPDLGLTGLDILRQLAERSDDAGASATRQLDRLALSSEKVQRIAASWRATRGRDDLDWIYHHVITRYGEGRVSIDTLRELLGDASQTIDYMMIWGTDERHPIALHVGFDQQRMIVSYSLK